MTLGFENLDKKLRSVAQFPKPRKDEHGFMYLCGLSRASGTGSLTKAGKSICQNLNRYLSLFSVKVSCLKAPKINPAFC